MVSIRKNLVDPNKYSIKCPYTMVPSFIVVHNTANDASAENEINYMKNNNNEVSFHIAVDDKEAVQGIEFNRNAWHAGDGANGNGNRNGIAIEICYSKSGGDRFNKAEQNAIELIADLLKKYGWGIDKVRKHNDFCNTSCPHRTKEHWNEFINAINSKLGNNNNSNIPNNNTKYKVGENVTINGVYTSSTSTQKLNPARKTGTITKIIPGVNNPYLLDNGNLGWVNDNCIVSNSNFSKNIKLYLPASATSWNVYPLNKQPVVGNECGKLLPAKFGGLEYDILRWTIPNIVCVIKTRDFGEVQIYVASGTGAVIK